MTLRVALVVPDRELWSGVARTVIAGRTAPGTCTGEDQIATEVVRITPSACSRDADVTSGRR